MNCVGTMGMSLTTLKHECFVVETSESGMILRISFDEMVVYILVFNIPKLLFLGITVGRSILLCYK